jgi:osmotically-inducible protein OsmY
VAFHAEGELAYLPFTMLRKLRKQVLDELLWDARIDATKVTVTIIDHTAVLRGSVHTYPEKTRCEQIVKRIRGITSVKNKIEVRLTIGDYRTDETLQRLAGVVLESIALLPEERPEATVTKGRVKLEGTVALPFQKDLAEKAVALIAGVREISNQIEVVPRVAPANDLESTVRRTLQRHLPRTRKIEVVVKGGRIALRGTVRTCAEKDDLLDLAWCAPGVTLVEDQLRVQP